MERDPTDRELHELDEDAPLREQDVTRADRLDDRVQEGDELPPREGELDAD